MTLKMHILFCYLQGKEIKELQKCQFLLYSPLVTSLRSKHMKSDRFWIYSLLSWDVTEHIFSREWPAPTVYQVLLGRILFHPSCWCYMQLLHQIIPLLTHSAEKVLEKQQGDEILSFRAQYSEYFVHYPQKQSASRADQEYPHFPASLGLAENPGSSASYKCCKSWARDRRE